METRKFLVKSKLGSRLSVRQMMFGAVASALVLCSFGLAKPASASVTLCPSQATVGGFGGSSSNVSGPLDGSCGADSAVQINIPSSTDYGKLQFNQGMTGYPPGLTLGELGGLSANVDFSATGAEQPYFLLAFTDTSNSLGQSAATDQILFIEFQPTTLSGNTLAVDPASTLFNLYDNTTGNYLQAGQQDTNSLDGWLASFSGLNNEGLDGIWIGEGLGAGNTGPESLTVNSLSISAVPEPAAWMMMLFGFGLTGLILRKRNLATVALS